MKYIFRLLLMVLLFSYNNIQAQKKFTLSGTVTDETTKETVIGASIYIVEAQRGTTTNEYGFYSIVLPAGTYTVQISSVSHAAVEETVLLDKDVRKNVSLDPGTQQLEEVVIYVNRNRAQIRTPEMSTNKLTSREMQKMPLVLGEIDPLKAILQLPGVTNAGEGASGFNVRGGAADQNLVLLDEATVYNTSHLFGFFSAFNADVIKDLKLYKGGIPARYGGRVSSVLDIFQKEGNKKEFHATGGIGTISSRLLLEGPIVKDRGSFVVAGRSSYAHLFLKLTNTDASLYFYDLNAKLNYKLTNNDNLYLSGYFGRDVMRISDAFNNHYGNTTVNLRWNHIFNNRIFTNLSMIHSNYYYGLRLSTAGFKWDTEISNYNLKYDWKQNLSNGMKLNYGVNAVYYDFNPGNISPMGNHAAINPKKLQRKYAIEPALYIEAEQDLTDRLSASYGLRYSMFYRMGAQTMNVYANDRPVVYNKELQIYESATPIGTKSYGSGDIIKHFDNFEPRLSLSYRLNDDQSIKVSYNRMSQYISMISNTTSATPLDVWAPSDQFIKPQIADQYALGYFRNFNNDDYSLEAEVFYKKVKNRIDYIDGADLIANEAIERVILNGHTRAYGLELQLRKNVGRFTGWISYTLSKTEQQTPGRTPDEPGINDGKWYHAAYDKPHNLSVTASYEYNKKWSFGAIFTLRSGQPVTYPNGQYQYGGLNIASYALRNENRLPVYHHLDLSATYIRKPEKKNGRHGEWVFSIYNVYERQNAASMSFRQNKDTGLNEAVKMYIFGIVPGITYNFKF